MVADTPLTDDDKEKLLRCVNYLERRRTCENCHGTGQVGGDCCNACARKTPYRKKQIVMTGSGMHVIYVTAYRGNGKTALASLQPTIDIVEQILAKYGAGVPTKLRNRADEIIGDLKSNNAPDS